MFTFRSLLIYILLGIFIIYLVLPMGLVLLGSFGEKWFGTPFPEGFTFEWFQELFTNMMFTRALWMSLLITIMTVCVNLLLGLPAVYAIYVSQNTVFKRLFDGLIILPIAVPPLVMGMGIGPIQAYNWSFFSLDQGAFGTAFALVGTGVNILPLLIYTQVSDVSYNLPLANTLAVLLTVVTTLLIYSYQRIFIR